MHQVSVIVEAEFVRFGEDRIHLFGVDVVVEVELVVGAAGDDGERRVGAFLRGGAQGVAEALDPAI